MEEYDHEHNLKKRRTEQTQLKLRPKVSSFIEWLNRYIEIYGINHDEDNVTIVIQKINKLLENGADINKREDYYGRSALDIAVCEGFNYRVIEHLLISGSEICHTIEEEDIEKFSDSMQPTLYYAICGENENNINTINMLLAHGANINGSNYDNDTALTDAACNGYTTIVELLINHGADIHRRNNIGNDALFCACINDHYDTVELLINRGANINRRNNEDETLLDIARLNNNNEIMNLLLKNGFVNDN